MPNPIDDQETLDETAMQEEEDLGSANIEIAPEAKATQNMKGGMSDQQNWDSLTPQEQNQLIPSAQAAEPEQTSLPNEGKDTSVQISDKNLPDEMSDEEMQKMMRTGIAKPSEDGDIDTENLPDEMTDEEMAKLISTMPNNVKTYETFDPSKVVNKSPLGFIERSALSTGTDLGREQYFKKRFGESGVKKLDDGYALRGEDGRWYRDDAKGWNFFSADGLKEVASDVIADMTAEGIRMGGQALGAGIGGAAGAPATIPTAGAAPTAGVIAGGALGRATGESIVKTLGSSMGLRPDDTMQSAYTDVVNQGLGGAAGEMGAPLIGKGLKIGGAYAKQGLKKAITKISKSQAFNKFSENFWTTVSGIPQWAVKEMHEKGEKLINSPMVQSWQGFIRPMLERASASVDSYNKYLYEQYMNAIKVASKFKIPIYDVEKAIQKNLSDVKVTSGTIRRQWSDAAQKEMEEGLQYLEGVMRRIGFKTHRLGTRMYSTGKELTLKKLHQIRRTIDKDIIKFQGGSERKPYLKDMMLGVRKGITELLHGESDTLAKISPQYKQAGGLYKAADARFETAQELFDEVSALGGSKLSRWERMLGKLMDLPRATRESLFEIEGSLPKNEQFLTDAMTLASNQLWNKMGAISMADVASLAAASTPALLSKPVALMTFTAAVMQRIAARPKLLAKLIFRPAQTASEWLPKAMTENVVAKGASLANRIAGRFAIAAGAQKPLQRLEEEIAKGVEPKAQAAETTQKKSPDSGSNAEIWEEVPTQTGDKIAESIEGVNTKAEEKVEEESFRGIDSGSALIDFLKEGLDTSQDIATATRATLQGVPLDKALKNPESVSFQNKALDAYWSSKGVQKLMKKKDPLINLALFYGGLLPSGGGMALDMATDPINYVIGGIASKLKGTAIQGTRLAKELSKEGYMADKFTDLASAIRSRLKTGDTTLFKEALLERGWGSQRGSVDLVPLMKVGELSKAEKLGSGLISTTLRALIARPQKVFTADQINAEIGRMSEDEKMMTGLDKFKAEGKVTKEELLDFVEKNKIEIKEVVKGGKDLGQFGGYFAKDEEAKSATKFAQYQLPGGDNYREVLLTLPKKRASFEELIKSMEGKSDLEQERIAEEDSNIYKNTFKSSHWDEPNVLAHFRLNDRTVNGKKTMFIEEIQSDWHQKGREEGYQKPEKQIKTLPDGYKVIETKSVENGKDYFKYAVKNPDGDWITSQDYNRESAINQALNYINKESGADIGVPNAPFKKTWHELVLKKILQEAVDKGYDQIAWTTGAQQAERYDLSKHIDEINVHNHQGKYDLTMFPKGGGSSKNVDDVSPEKLSEYVGKELAQKIIDEKIGLGKDKAFRGLDLKVGGEGMKGFYDQMIPQFLNKYTKKWGGRVGESTIDAFDRSKRYESREARQEALKGSKVHSLEITPSMKAELKEGVPTQGGGLKSKWTSLSRFVEGKDIDVIRSGAEAKKIWGEIYKKAIPIPHTEIVEFKGGKLDGVATVHLTKNCQRINYLQAMKKLGALDKSVVEESCYGGACYKDRQLDTRLNPSKPKISERPIEFATPEAIDKALTPDRVAKMNEMKFIRLGQAGDDSHAIHTGLAKAWLEKSAQKGITKPSVFVTSAYAPTTPEDYKALAPYKDKFVLHVTQSGYFSKEEILNRMNEFMKARDAGLNVRMRVITNKDQVSYALKRGDIDKIGAMKTPNEQFLFDLIKKHGVQNSGVGEVILETPYHNDFLKNKLGTERSQPTGLFKAVCCQTGKCVSCSESCLLGKKNNPKGALMSLTTAFAGGLLIADEFGDAAESE